MSRGPRKDTPENIAKARALKASGMCWEHIAREFGMANGSAIRRWLDPEYLEITRQRHRQWWRDNHVDTFLPRERVRPSQEEIKARLREIPPDTRTLTGQLCGDPLPGRDALSKMDRCLLVDSSAPWITRADEIDLYNQK